jgi:hypothetical protein
MNLRFSVWRLTYLLWHGGACSQAGPQRALFPIKDWAVKLGNGPPLGISPWRPLKDTFKYLIILNKKI